MKIKLAIVFLLLFIIIPTIQAQTCDDYIKTGDEYYNMLNFEKAIQYYDKATDKDPQNIEAWYRKVYANLEMGFHDNLKEAMYCCDKIIKIDDTQYEAYYYFAESTYAAYPGMYFDKVFTCYELCRQNTLLYKTEHAKKFYDKAEGRMLKIEQMYNVSRWDYFVY